MYWTQFRCINNLPYWFIVIPNILRNIVKKIPNLNFGLTLDPPNLRFPHHTKELKQDLNQ